MSQAELDIARASLPDSVQLLRQRAQDISLSSGSVDIVVSHMALMLMDDIETVTKEIRRILRTGGTLAAVVGRTFLLGEAFDIFLERFKHIAKNDAPLLSIGDRRTRSSEGWVELLEPHFSDLRFEDLDVPLCLSPDELWISLVETYDVDRLSEASRHRLKEELIRALERLQNSDGKIKTGWGLRLIRCLAA
jgi:SAM-dependent methyltransferase